MFNIRLFHGTIIKEVIDMENNKKEKAIASAIASLRIDKIYLKDEFINEYRKKNNLHVEQAPKLTLRKDTNKWH